MPGKRLPFLRWVLLFLVFIPHQYAIAEKRCSGELEDSFYQKNPLRRPSDLFLGAIPFDQITISHFRPAFVRALRVARTRIDELSRSNEVPTFQNTIEPLERALEPLEQVLHVFYNFLSMNTCPALEALAEKIGPERARLMSRIYSNSSFFQKVLNLYSRRKSLNLSTEEEALLSHTYRTFIQHGAQLNQQQKLRLRKIDERLSLLSNQFKQNLNRVFVEHFILVTDTTKLSGLSKSQINAAAHRAINQGHPGSWIFTLQSPGYETFMTSVRDRSLRREMWEAHANVASSGSTDNRPLLLEIARLRREAAQLLGYRSHAHYALEESMLNHPDEVRNFLNQLAEIYRPAAAEEIRQLRDLAGHEIEPWDLPFYSEKIRVRDYGYTQKEILPYFPLYQVLEGAFYAANRSYGIQFVRRYDLPLWNEHVLAYEVKDKNGNSLALFYFDPFSRSSKRSGAWMKDLRSGGGVFSDQYRPAHIINVANFSAPQHGAPALLHFQNVITVFHEIGHALHAILSKTRYPALWGTRVARDFVEFPSQINEYRALDPDVLNVMARHYQSGEKIPAFLLEQLKRSQNFHVGLHGLRLIRMSMLDLAWHDENLDRIDSIESVAEWEDLMLAPYRVPGIQHYSSVLSSGFRHIFAGGYAAGYYSYAWSKVLASDAFRLFEQKGAFDPEISLRFQQTILETGRSEDPMTLYRRFLGRDPDPLALARREGLVP